MGVCDILQGKPLHLERIAYIGGSPLEKISAAQYFPRRVVNPERILSVAVPEDNIENLAADRDIDTIFES